MLLNEKRTTVAYRCPDCGAGVMSAVGLFKLSADLIKLKCTCADSELQIVYNRDGTVRLTVPCMLCSTPHTFTVKSSLFFSDELFVLPCPYSGINICFTGEINHVKAELARTELELLDMLEEQGITDFSALHGDERDLADPQILDIVMFVINDLDAEGKIFCRCHPDPALMTDTNEVPAPHADPTDTTDTADSEESRYEAEVTDEGIRLTCRHCGASRTVPTDSMLSAHAFLNADSLHLE
jgi:hypothetical protein